MSKASIIIDGAGCSVTFNGTSITDINTISFGTFGDRDEIDLTTLDASGYKVGRLGDLVGINDIVINKKFDPAADLAIVTTNKPMVISFKVGKATAKTLTIWCMFKGASPGTVERAPGDGVNNDLTFAVTNLQGATLNELGPTFA